MKKKALVVPALVFLLAPAVGGADTPPVVDHQPAFCTASRLAGIGPVPMIFGSTPCVAQDTIRANGVRPLLSQ